MLEQLPKEVRRRTDIEREVRIVFRRIQLSLRVVQRHRTQVIGRPVVRTYHDMRHRYLLIRQHPEILREIRLRREAFRHLESIIRLLHRGHAIVEGVDTHLLLVVPGQQIPALLESLQGVGTDCLHIAFCIKLLVAQTQAMVGLHGIDDGLQEFLTCRRVLQNDAISERDAVGEHVAHCQRREHPAFDSTIVKRLRIGDKVFIGILVTFDDDAKHVEDGIPMAIERGACERTAPNHIVILPKPADILKLHPLILSQCIQYPNILLKNLCRFHCYLGKSLNCSYLLQR